VDLEAAVFLQQLYYMLDLLQLLTSHFYKLKIENLVNVFVAIQIHLSTLSNYEGVSKSFRTGRLELEVQMVQLCAVVSLFCESV
jgi:hypothetical protein